eukprot:GGOE01001399.1.p1 GENE.GGOE01001399.1~~GGOE01001399.1.p1  ORF type:complete len:510 (+),score=77.22 GGOE01001399.1:134-1531(+)
MAHTAYLALGSNVGDRVAHIQHALQLLVQHSDTQLNAVSFLYQTPAAYVTDQAPFLNCACRITTDLSPPALLQRCKELETHIGRTQTIRWGPREVDVDVIFYDDLVIDFRPAVDLVVPHERAHERAFVLGPISDVAPSTFHHPALHSTIPELLARVGTATLQPVVTLGCQRVHPLGERTLIMGILNVTPDSFSDGGAYLDLSAAVERAQDIADAGADILDVGGQSTRPGAAIIDAEDELRRVVPVIQAVRKAGLTLPISIDTFRSRVAAEAIRAGANIINDVSGGLLDDAMVPLAAALAVPICMMHYRGDPSTMVQLTQYPDVVGDVQQHLETIAKRCGQAGVFPWNVWLDPGLGFAKTPTQSIQCLQHTQRFLRCNASRFTPGRHALLVGPSRKGFVGRLLQDTGPQSPRRAWGTAAACYAAIQGGADILRVHDVPQMRDVALVADEIARPQDFPKRGIDLPHP